MKINSRLFLNIALVVAVACLIINVLNINGSFKTYGIENFLLAAALFMLAYDARGDERRRIVFILGLVGGVLSIASGVMGLLTLTGI